MSLQRHRDTALRGRNQTGKYNPSSWGGVAAASRKFRRSPP